MQNKLFNTERFDLIHCQDFSGIGLLALYLSRKNKIPIIGTNHTYIDPFIDSSQFSFILPKKIIKRYISWYYGKCDFVSVPSKFLIQEMQKNGFAHHDYSVISNPVNTILDNHESKEHLKKKFLLLQNTILYVGRISEEKNIQVLLDAFLLLAQKIPTIDLVIIGNGILKNTFIQQIKMSRFYDRIKIIGPFVGEQRKILYEYFHASNIFVMPSTSETQSIATLEAMIFGLVPVVARAGSLPEVVTEERGFIFNPNSVLDLERCLHKIISNNKDHEKIIQNAKTFALSLSSSNIALKWIHIYEEVIKSYASNRIGNLVTEKEAESFT